MEGKRSEKQKEKKKTHLLSASGRSGTCSDVSTDAGSTAGHGRADAADLTQGTQRPRR